MTDKMTADDRRAAFVEDLGRDHEWDYAQWLHELIIDTLGHVESFMGSDLAAAPLRQLAVPLADKEFSETDTWRDILENSSCPSMFYGEVNIGSKFCEAAEYGLYGITPKDVPVSDRGHWLTKLVAEITSFAARSDVQGLRNGNNTLTRIANLAASRYAIDFGKGEVDLKSMATLAGISEGRVRNLLSEKDNTLERGPNGGIIAMSAASWLQKKKGYLASIWMEEEPLEETADEGSTLETKSTLFVPMARDGSLFTPDLIRNGAYQIGAKGHEEKIEDFSTALSRLNSMSVPRWRRPNENGIWGIVSGVAWQRIESAGAYK